MNGKGGTHLMLVCMVRLQYQPQYGHDFVPKENAGCRRAMYIRRVPVDVRNLSLGCNTLRLCKEVCTVRGCFARRV